ncbi:hypothetical protein BJ138DRAFT_1115784 [Hygrophoropsis aurantiaca]|uniref:Uncharacterized protein n=1 Tax=Hygrophoropsis aurantiaca TaxID=72124 RepID=A0ACB8A626_9AGAM|nr:hypothetical protein BJ138DRAFT_1115784 [Hygrophoropsis aurantiaca]
MIHEEPSSVLCQNHFGLPSQRTSVQSLPTELLLIIFTHLYRRLSSGFNRYGRMSTQSIEVSESGSSLPEFDPTLFPYALSSVCVAWRDTMALVPEFWTHLLVIVNLNASKRHYMYQYRGCRFTSKFELFAHLAWSRNLPLKVHVVTRYPTTPGVDEQHATRILENRCITDIMQILAPHIHRCCALRFQVIYSSSLPILRQHLQRSTWPTRLKELILDCSVADYDSFDAENTTIHEWHPCPSLHTLHLDGRSFRDICSTSKAHNSWLTYLPCLHVLTISHSRIPISIAEFFRVLSSRTSPSIWTLKVQDVEFYKDNDDAGSALYEFGFSPELIDLKSSSLCCFFRALAESPTQVTLTRCSFASIGIIKASELFLREIIAEEDMDLANALTPWQGHTLNIHSCPAFNDVFLRRMNPEESHLDEIYNHRPFPACQFWALEISDCRSFSISALQALVRARREAAVEEAGYELVDGLRAWNMTYVRLERVRPIVSIVIMGRAPEITMDEMKWFEDNVAYFYWSGN